MMESKDKAGSLLWKAGRIGVSVARTAWKSRYNRLWRFARFKWILISQLLQLIFIWWISQKAAQTVGAGNHAGFVAVSVLLFVQFGWSGLMQGFMNGQYQLFRGSLVPLYQVSPAPPLGFTVGRVLEHIPRRIWSSLLWAWAYSIILPAHGGIWGFLLLACLATVSATVSFLTGLLALILWQAYAPRGVKYGLAGGIVLQVGLVSWAAVYLTVGGTFQELLHLLSESRTLLVLFGILIGAVPGISMLVIGLTAPERIDRLYKRGLHHLLELDQSTGIAKRSLYLALPNPIWRAILSREWISLLRAPFTKFKILTYTAAILSEFFIGHAAASRLNLHLQLVLLGLPLISWLLIFAGDSIMAFPAEGANLQLYRLTGVPAWKLLMSKGVALWVPSFCLTTLAVLVGVLSAKLSLLKSVGLLLYSIFVLAAGMASALGVSAGSIEIDAEELGLARNSPGTGQMGAWGFVGLLAAALPIAIACYLAAGSPGHWVPWQILVSMIVFIPILLIVWGHRRLIRRYL